MMLEGRRAVVTGAAGAGIGFAVAQRFLKEGAHVLLTDSSESRLAIAGNRLAADFGSNVDTLTVDVSSTKDVQRLAKHLAESRVDILFNNAGLFRNTLITETSDELWDELINVNLGGPFRLIRAVLPLMINQQSGSIINVASQSGWIPLADGEAPYCAAKAGVMGLTRAVALEVGKHGIRVNAIAPGMTMNPFVTKSFPAAQVEAIRKATPLQRTAEPSEIAALAVFLASEEASFISGEVVACTGGFYMHA